MLKQTVAYTDFDDNETVETLYFNLTKTELTDNLHLTTELERIQKMTEGDKRKLDNSEVTSIINLVKTFMRLSYGIRSQDGKRFMKSDEQWREFTETAAYDAFLFGLFEEPQRALDFMSGILPKDLRERARAAADAEIKRLESGGTEVSAKVEVVDVDKDVAEFEAWKKAKHAAPES